MLEELDGRREMGRRLLRCSGREDGGLAEVVAEEEVDGGGGRREPGSPQDRSGSEKVHSREVMKGSPALLGSLST